MGRLSRTWENGTLDQARDMGGEPHHERKGNVRHGLGRQRPRRILCGQLAAQHVRAESVIAEAHHAGCLLDGQRVVAGAEELLVSVDSNGVVRVGFELHFRGGIDQIPEQSRTTLFIK